MPGPKLFFVLAGLALATPATALEPLPRTPAEAARVEAVTAPATDFSAPEPYEARPGGGATVAVPVARRAFSHPVPGGGAETDVLAGQALFEKLWVAAPTATRASDGLGPLYSARACAACHVHNGRGFAPEVSGATSVPLVLQLGHRATPDPIYGRQLQVFGTIGQVAEGRVRVEYTDEPVALADGTEILLRRPAYSVMALAFGPLAPGTALSPRIAPPLPGLGLIEAIPAEDILALADPDDADGDGISGRASLVPSATGGLALARFGFTADNPTVAAQTAHAFANDLGLSTPAHSAPWGDCTEAQTACRAGPHGDGDARGTEVDAEALRLTALYVAALAVPARRDIGAPQVLRGKQVFYASGCIACHRPKFVTARRADDPARSFQLIWPYSDLLLHDMGAGLADGRGTEWRTAPLWGIGRTADVGGRAGYLHDGRARSLLEAILWHGGEALGARARVVALPAPDRDALIRFLESL